MKFGLYFAATLAVFYLLVCALLFLFQRSLLYLPARETADLAEHPGLGLRAVELPGTEDQDEARALTHWYAPPSGEDRPVVVVFHGNAGHIGHRVPKFEFLVERGYGLLLVGYPGYGGNPGAPSQSAFLAAGRGVLNWLAGQDVSAERTVLYGESLGTASATILAAERAGSGPYAGVILEAPFTSIADVAAHHYWYVPARWLLHDPWQSAAVVDRIASPLLVIHGRRDATVPFVFGERLLAAAREPKDSLFLDDASHNDLYEDRRVTAAVVAFVEQHGGTEGR